MNITIKDIAKKANVSIGTVDRVLHNRGEVAKRTREKIMTIIKELEYTPDVLAQSLASNRNSKKFAVLIPDSSGGVNYWKLPLIGMKQALIELNHFGVKADFYFFELTNEKSFSTQFDKIIKNKPDGLLLSPFFRNEAISLIQKWDHTGIPYVLIDSGLSNQKNISYIGQNSYQSGVVAGKLIDYGLSGNDEIIIVSITDQRDNNNHISRRVEGFISYFNNRNINIIEIPFKATDELNKRLSSLVKNNVKGIFVPNSRAYKVARFIESKKIKDIKLLGYDITDDNIYYLKKDIISFLIGQRPEEQGYKGIMSLFNHVVMKKEIQNNQYIPIDIVMKENIDYYK